MDDLIIAIAKAIAREVARSHGFEGTALDRRAEYTWEKFVPHAKAAWAVAAEPTEAMLQACECDDYPQSVRAYALETWQAMHGAATPVTITRMVQGDVEPKEG